MKSPAYPTNSTLVYVRAEGGKVRVYEDAVGRLLFRWPGDEWVDFVGMDCYHGRHRAAFVANVEALDKVAELKTKPVGVTETGLENNHTANYWTNDVLSAMQNSRAAFVVAWRNDKLSHAYGPYPSSPCAADFVKYYNDAKTLFQRDLPDMYTMPKGVKVK